MGPSPLDGRNIAIALLDFGRKSGPILGERNRLTSTTSTLEG